MINVYVKLQYLSNKHRIELARVVALRCQPCLGHTLTIDNDIVVELINDRDTKTYIQINDVSADYDMNIVNTTYYHYMKDADLAESINYYIDNGWDLLCDSCGLLKAQEEEK
jgi:hypothetical protein